MTNYSAKILNNATGALAAQQAVIAATSNNIANVNTPGYSRRVVELQTRASTAEGSGLSIGNGVEVGRLNRLTDSFLEKLLREGAADQSSFGVQSELLKRVDALFALDGNAPTIGSTLTAFFAAADDLTADPSSIPLRQAFIERGNDLVTAIRSTYNTIASIQDEANTRIATEVDTVNSLTEQIAFLNGNIRANERTGNVAADDRDRRDVLLQKLSEKLDFNTIELADGTVQLSLSNGFVLVNGTESRELSVTNTPSFASGTIPPSLSGGVLNYVVYDYSGGNGTPAHVDLSNVIKTSGGGTIGGLLQLRGTVDANSGATTPFAADGLLVEAASRVEAIAYTLATTVNESYLGGDADPSTPLVLDTRVGDLDGNTPADNSPGDYAFSLFSYNYAGGALDADGDGFATNTDWETNGITSIASVLSFGISDPRRIAAAENSGTLIAPAFAPGDGRNMQALAALKDQSYTFAASGSSISVTGTFGDAYAEAVGFVGNQKRAIDIQYSAAKDNLLTAQNSRDEISGVSLDEEFASLIKFQKAYQASAKMMQVADTLLDQIVGLI